ncbi:MAG: hypothetical protein LC659_09970, partial [Myxococcales bacterium]|nr:hypothetical protein [Myxococcales bacterium]
LGWKAYCRLAETPNIFRTLDKWIRHRLRTLQLKQWKRGTTTYRELRRLGAPEAVARTVAANCRRWARNARMHLHITLPNAHFEYPLHGPRPSATTPSWAHSRHAHRSDGAARAPATALRPTPARGAGR